MNIKFNKVTVFIGENLEKTVELINTCEQDFMFYNLLERQLSPTKQIIDLYEKLKWVNHTQEILIFTTYSPYILNALTLAIKAKGIKQQNIVPKDSCIDAKDVTIYELTEDGSIRKLPMIDDLPSDDNYLNNHLRVSNDLFDQLLELESLSS